MQYRVVYVIDVEADSREEAVKETVATLLKQLQCGQIVGEDGGEAEYYAPVFEVIDKEGTVIQFEAALEGDDWRVAVYE